MLSWLLLLCPWPVLGALEKTYGVLPSLLSQYTPEGEGSIARWTCLDGTRQIAWDAVNDDYCDCPDGSDEPGTSACPNGVFYCVNAGHIGAAIRSTRVNDGLCEPECCDGSDEQPGICPNVCREVGEVYRRKQEAELKLRKTGAKIRSSYIAFAKKEKTRLEALAVANKAEVAQRTKEVERLKDILDRVESVSAAELEHKKQSPLYKSLVEHSNALKSLKREYEKLKENEKTLEEILNTLRSGYNPNYQDMAVLEAVRGWEYYAGLPHIGDKEPTTESTSEGSQGGEEPAEPEEPEQLEEGAWTKERLDRELGALLSADYTNLLLEHDNHVDWSAIGSVLFDISSYIPDSVQPQYDAFKEVVVTWLERLGIARGKKDNAAETTKARKTYHDGEHSLNMAKREGEDVKRDLERLFDPKWYGKEGEWKKLAGQCLSTDAGGYTYEVCLFDEARQKPNKGGMNFSLGKFSSWNTAPGVEVGSPEYYSRQVYKGGARCWNGPERSVTVVWSCGTENAITSVSEPEKCEYEFVGTSPALCLPPDAWSSKFSKDEL